MELARNSAIINIPTKRNGAANYFGAVVAEVNKITPDGLPVLLIENAPPEIKSPGFQLTRPEIYFGEKTQDPVFVHTAREEFDYPSGENRYTNSASPLGSKKS